MILKKKVKRKPVPISDKKIAAKEVFPNLPSFHSIAVIFSYMGFDDKIRAILSQLSHKTRSYTVTHDHALKSFPVIWKPQISHLLDFGDEKVPYDAVFPDEEKLSKLPTDRQVRIHTLKYSQWLDCLFMSGVQVEFAIGAKRLMKPN